MWKFKCFIILSSFLLALPSFAQVFYVNNSDGNLLLLDMDGCVTQVVVGIGSYTDIATHPNGYLYAVRTNGTLYRVNTNNGVGTQVADFPGSGYFALTANANGDIFAATGNGGLASYNPITNAITNYPNMGYGASGDLTFHQGDMYMAATNNTMVRIHPDEPENNVQVINFSSSSATIFGIVSAVDGCDTKTYAISDDNNSRVFEIDWDNAAFNEVCTLPHRIYGGASEFEFNASEQQMALEAISIEAECGDATADVIVTATSVNGGLTYSLNNMPPQGSGEYPDLPYGEYELLLTDAGGCSLTETFTVSPANNIVVNDIQVTQAACGELNGTIEVWASSTESGLLYSLDGQSFSANNYFEDVPPGDYTLTLTDDSGCNTLVNASIASTPQYQYLGHEVVGTSCGEDNGRIRVEVEANGNEMSYSLGNIQQNNTGVFDSIPSGEYLLTISDTYNCEMQIELSVAASEAISVPEIQTHPPDCNTPNGEVVVVSSANALGLFYTLNGQGNNTGVFTGLPAGNYTLQVNDADGCSLPPISIEWEDPCGIYIPNAFSPNNDGYNDRFRLYSPVEVEVRSLQVFNRWGGLVYEDGGYSSSDITRGWGGEADRQPAASGTYLYLFHIIKNGQEEWWSGDVNVLR